MNNISVKYFIVVVCVFHFFRPLSAQNDTPVLMNRDTINFEGELTCRRSYKCDGDYWYYITTKEPTPQIKEIVYSDGSLRSKYFIDVFPNVSYMRIDYNRDGTVSFSCFSIQIEYKNMKYDCPVNSFYDKKGNIYSSLYLQDLRGHIITEYSCYNNSNWKRTSYHNTHPPRYAKKLFKIFLTLNMINLLLL